MRPTAVSAIPTPVIDPMTATMITSTAAPAAASKAKIAKTPSPAIFEVKSVSDTNEVAQIREAVSQLYE